jgi:phosphopantetheinyl transferase (holo-ACP synthase)
VLCFAWKESLIKALETAESYVFFMELVIILID